jgi:DNA-binding transcriptional ArsR family regulator
VFYGLDLQLRIPEGTREIRTGTLLQNDRGLPGRIIQLLHMRPLETGASFRIEESIKVDLYAPRLHLVGHLTTPPAHGQLTWGVASWTGDLDALRAAGHFDIAAQDPYTIAMSGETVTPPPAAAAGAPTAANGEAAWVVGAVATGLLLAAAALLFYARMSPSRALRHPRRQAILDYVRQNPGAEAASAGRHLGLSRGVLLHHLRQLRISGHLRVQKTEGRTALFAADAGWRGREAAAVLMRRETPRRLHACIDSQPGLDQAQLVHRLGLSQSRVSQVLNRLEAAGLLRKEIRGGRWAYYAEAEPTGASNPAPAEAAASAA